eukprot:2988172-Pyramimonas_sp.AAC.1
MGVGGRDVQVQCGDARHPLYFGSDNAALWTALASVASLPAGRPATTFGCIPTKKGMLQMTRASRLSPKVHLAFSMHHQELRSHRECSLCQ